MKGVGNEMVQPGSRGSRGRCRGRRDIRARKEMGDETSTQLGCWLVSMIRVASTRALRRHESVRLFQVKVWKAPYRSGAVGCGRRGGPGNLLGLSEGGGMPWGGETRYSGH